MKNNEEVITREQSSNDIQTLDEDSTIDESIGELLKDSDNPDDERRDKFIVYWLSGLSVTQAGLKAGYSKHYSRGGLHKAFKHGPAIRKRISEISANLPDRYREISRLQLIELANAEGKAVKEYVDNPRLLIEKPQLARDIKRSAGVLSNDEESEPVMVQINLELGQQMIWDSLRRDDD